MSPQSEERRAAALVEGGPRPSRHHVRVTCVKCGARSNYWVKQDADHAGWLCSKCMPNAQSEERREVCKHCGSGLRYLEGYESDDGTRPGYWTHETGGTHCALYASPSIPTETREERLEKALRDFLDHLDIGCCRITNHRKKMLQDALERKG